MLMLRAATEGEWLERESSSLKGMEARGGRRLCGKWKFLTYIQIALYSLYDSSYLELRTRFV